MWIEINVTLANELIESLEIESPWTCKKCTVQLYGFQGGIIDIELTDTLPPKTPQAQVHVCGMKLPFLWQMSRLSPLRLNPLGHVKWTWAPIFRPSIRLSSSTSEMSNSGHSMSGKKKTKGFVYKFYFEVKIVFTLYEYLLIVVLSD